MSLTWLADELRKAGLTVIEHRDWRTHDRPGSWSPRYGVVHATAAPRSQPDSVQIAVVRDGRSDLPGPIANAVIDRQGRWHVVSAGRCNSTLVGTAGPYKGLGNTYALSTEACNDNRGEPWPPAQYESYVRGWAVLCRRLGWSPSHLVGHKEHTPSRKTDPTFDMARFRRDVAEVLAGEDDDMTRDDIRDAVIEALGTALPIGANGPAARLRDKGWAAKISVLGLLAYIFEHAVDGRPLAELAALRTELAALTGRDPVDEAAVAAQLLTVLTPAAIAAALPAETARQVAAELATRLQE
ncbi:N-acetylmuramoyl-L-alanine amidase [Micromonospora aurantiaca]|uniref:peptidoglycan recognition protein family protein n=1 Tax=Micromonospora aurantiaca (nom. illeg.) TaxID=47850 RepID=UPI00343CE87A